MASSSLSDQRREFWMNALGLDAEGAVGLSNADLETTYYENQEEEEA